MPQVAYPIEVLEQALLTWAEAVLVEGGVATHKGYERYARSRQVPSSSTLAKRLGGNNWGALLVARSALLVDAAADDTAVVELPVPCAGRGRLSWQPMRLRDWPGQRCTCELCEQPTIAQLYPDLIGRLLDPGDATLANSRWVQWACPAGRSTHRPMDAPAERIADGRVFCGPCRAHAAFYASHSPGQVYPNTRPRPQTATEQALAEALRSGLKDTDGSMVLTDHGVVLPPLVDYHGAFSLHPDLLLPACQVAVELDGGTGNSRYSRHDTDAGVADDERRDELLAGLGWSTIRLHQPGARSLHSPAIILLSSSRTPRILAALVMEALTQSGRLSGWHPAGPDTADCR